MEKVFLYVIGQRHDQPPFKIGVSVRPATRLRELQTGSPVELRLLHQAVAPLPASPFEHERAIHDYFADRRLKGEWFAVPLGEIRAAIEMQITTGLFAPIKPNPRHHVRRRLYYSRSGREQQALAEYDYLMRELRR